MLNWQLFILIGLFAISLFSFIKGLHESKNNKASYKQTTYLYPLGIFVWGDAVIFGVFWAFVALVSLILRDWFLFLLIVSVFWLVRSIGETIYWFNQQFSKVKRNQPKEFWIYKIFKNDSVWFIHQIFWQVITITTILTTLYLAHQWLNKLN